MALIDPTTIKAGRPHLPNMTGEALIERPVTFRLSTFGALKDYMREHQKRTGVALTNAAAVDLLIRKALGC
ncbi:hypothetical protein [Ottowia testudinis]|uniref:Uncharacterized protein n=1 Tax=Ottowia testudinis TaxID=2816950 RepID=A0A975CE78_9BURK|nr:hypothetical protein [Ottowia testudinis]QTD44217.1 hypothetical protein J1M35_13925 [Ottowia testudinis]